MRPNLAHLYDATPVWLALFFAGTTLLTLFILFIAIRRVSSVSVIRLFGISLVWLISLGLLAHNHFFQQLNAIPPHFLVAIGPPLLLIISLLITAKGRFSINQLPLSVLTLLHTIRIPVELTLYGLYLHQQIPQLMTFEGRNYDIFAGLTAPLITYYFFKQRQLKAGWLLLWNLLAIGLLVNIVSLAILSAPFPFQQLAFDQPNVGVLKVPYVWLPGFIVPAVLFSHAVAIQRLVGEVFGISKK